MKIENIEFTKEWLKANKIAIRCYTEGEADGITLIYNCEMGVFDEFESPTYYYYESFWELPMPEHTIVDASEVIAAYEAREVKDQKPLFGSFDDLICYLVKKGNSFESIKFGDEIIDKAKYSFTPEFEKKLNELGIKV